MSAFFFGPSDRQLFGYLHVGQGAARGAAVICPPWAAEYQYAHRAVHFMARRLAAEGFHVLRFDYSGTGDSWGASTEADFERWSQDVRLAMDEIRASSGVEQVDLVGLRLGGYVAARAARMLPGVGRVVLWDPIVEGERWLAQQGAAIPASDAEEREVAGALVSGRFLQQFEAVQSDAFGIESAEGVLVVLTQRETWDRDDVPVGDGVKRLRLEQPAPWVEDESIWTGQVPVEAVAAITEWLT